MRNAILRDLAAEYEQLRADNATEEERRRQEVAAKCPEIDKLLSERREIIYRGVRAALDGQGKNAADLPPHMAMLTERIVALLKENGYSPDYLEPVYRCPKCRDIGYVGEPLREMCECMQERYYARLYRSVGLREQSNQSFATFDLSLFSADPLPGMAISQRDCMRALLKGCQSYADTFPNSRTPDLLLMGQSGLGKTFLMHAMAKRLLERGNSVLFISAYRFLEMARKAYFSGTGEEIRPLLEAGVLLLDDLGSEPLMENITVVQLFNLINERQTGGKGTVLSTNLNLEELRRRYTERIVSRLCDPTQCTHMVFQGEDIRRRKACSTQ